MRQLRLPRPRRAPTGRALRCGGRSILVVAAIAATCTPAWAGATSPPVVGSYVTGRVTAGVTACHAAGEIAGRYATFAAEMTAIESTQQMSLRLQLYQHTPGTLGYHLVSSVPGFGVWERSAPGVSIFDYSQEVTHLVAPASFRVQVGYRWLDSGHHVIRRATRTTAACVEPNVLANLVAGAVSIGPGAASGTASYDVEVRNDGAAAAGPFDVGFSVGGVPLAPQPVSALAAGTRTALSFAGPACAQGATVEVTVDAGHAIQESTEADDTRTLTCK